MNDTLGREAAIFAAALELPAGERDDYVAHECGDDPALKARVTALLRADSEAGNFMEAPPGASPSRNLLPIGEKAGDLIGRYRLLQQIGEGGCGVVFMAEQGKRHHRGPVKRLEADLLQRAGRRAARIRSSAGAGETHLR